MATIEEKKHIFPQNRCSGRVKGQVMDCSFTNSKDARQDCWFKAPVFLVAYPLWTACADGQSPAATPQTTKRAQELVQTGRTKSWTLGPFSGYQAATDRQSRASWYPLICSPTQPMLSLQRTQLPPLMLCVQSCPDALHLSRNVQSSKALNTRVVNLCRARLCPRGVVGGLSLGPD